MIIKNLFIIFVLISCHFVEAKDDHASEHKEHARHKSDITAEKAYTFLQNGNIRFYTSRVRNDGFKKKDRNRLIASQSPHAIILSCSDSRVPPEVVFDQKLGEIFVVRTAGQSLDFAAIASIEYAIAHLGSNLIVVMGHESCGAVKAALSTLKGGDAGSLWLNKLVADLHPHLKQFTDLTPTDGVIVESWANVEGVTKDLVERSAIVKKAIESGEVTVQKALYHLGSGVVEWR
jgi:carbonic anhydrase